MANGFGPADEVEILKKTPCKAKGIKYDAFAFHDAFV